ncbi:MAG: serine/threonine protein kinase [Planctomycetes bacterium]|nr:serine/threonine protein kinase [Planctomycetota bacterium]
MADPADRPESSGSARDPVERLLVQVIEVLEKDGPDAVEALLRAHPDEARGVREFLDRLQQAGLVGGDGRPGQPPQRLGEFRILGPLGQGGMGAVYRAVQESLGREVALKLIRPDQLFFAGARERFRREVELVARMQHPGIVPIHAVGNEQGLPYFAMELVRGATLAAVITRLHGRAPVALRGEDLVAAIAAETGEPVPPTPPAIFQGSWAQVALRIVREVAEALDHAHRRGVLHRDVKPSNVMVTAEGRVLLLDFGLAGGEGGERLTRTGAVLGSIAYMPPELLRGEAATGDVRADVYSLGVTCWELLTLELPYQGSDPVRVRQLAEAATRPRLAQRNPAATWELDAVLGTAMDPEPARRYATVAEFAQDLDNLLALRPIRAREPGLWRRLHRWLQRHPARATGLLAAVLLVAVGPSVFAWQQHRARALIEVEAQRARANFQQLQMAVDTMLAKVGDDSLRDIPRMEVVRRELLEEALAFYARFLAEQPDRPDLQLEAARLRLRAAEVHGLLGDHARSAAEVERALERLGAVEVPDRALQRELAQAAARLATARRLRGELAAAATAAMAAIERWQARAADTPDDVASATGLALARIEAGLIAADRGDLAAAQAQVERALDELAPWQARPGAAGWLDRLTAKAADWSGVWALQQAMQTRSRQQAMPLVERAIAQHRRAREAWVRALQGQPSSQLRADAVQNTVNLAIALQSIGQIEECRDLLVEAVDRAAALVADYPAAPRRRVELANARSNLGAAFGSLGQIEDCRAQHAAARDLWRELTQQAPEDDAYWNGLATSLQGLCAASFYGGEPAAARELAEAAAAAADRALAVRPGNPTYRRLRRKIAETIAEVCLQLDDVVAAAAATEVLLEERLAPGEPVLAAALLARCAHALAAAGLEAGDRMARARELLRTTLAGGRSLADLRRDRSLAGQWGQPGWEELVAEFAPSDK